MSQYDVTYSCGHKGSVSLFGPTKERDSKLGWYERTAVCPDCYKTQKESERRQKDEQAKQFTDSMGLPKLSGSEKQIAWAESIRAEKLPKAKTAIDKMVTDAEGLKKFTDDPDKLSRLTELDTARRKLSNGFLENITNQASAKWWIDNKDLTVNQLYTDYIKDKPEYLEFKQKSEQKQKEKEQAKEAVVDKIISDLTNADWGEILNRKNPGVGTYEINGHKVGLSTGEWSIEQPDNTYRHEPYIMISTIDGKSDVRSSEDEFIETLSSSKFRELNKKLSQIWNENRVKGFKEEHKLSPAPQTEPIEKPAPEPEVAKAEVKPVEKKTGLPYADLRARIKNIESPELDKLTQVQLDRNPGSQIMDKARKHSIIVEPGNPRVRRWMRDQGTMDVLGIDTPPGITKANSFPKVFKVKPPKAKRMPKMRKEGTPHIVPPHPTRRGAGVTRRSNR